MTAFFNRKEVTDYETAAASDTKMYAAYFHAMLDRGIYLAPSQFEAAFVSLVHGDEEISATTEAARKALHAITD